MPSPFPGMDPYLEARELWPGVHNELIVQMRHLLVAQVRPKYFVDIEKRVYVIDEDDPAQRAVVADVAVTSTGRPGRTSPAGGRRWLEPAVVLMAQETEVREARLVIRAARQRTVVTIVELLSHANRVSAGSRGRQEYLAKRREVLRSGVHLVEVDLLRAGQGLPSVDPLPPGDYHAHVSRVTLRPRGEVFSWGLRDPLPVIPLPLRDEDVELDLGLALTRAYDEGGYDVEIDYDRPPEPPLPVEDQAWAGELLGPESRG